jgi:hypothetical protein
MRKKWDQSIGGMKGAENAKFIESTAVLNDLIPLPLFRIGEGEDDCKPLSDLASARVVRSLEPVMKPVLVFLRALCALRERHS